MAESSSEEGYEMGGKGKGKETWRSAGRHWVGVGGLELSRKSEAVAEVRRNWRGKL